MSTQPPLLNTRSMSSAREMNALKRSRERQKLVDRGVTPKQPTMRVKPLFADTEFSLPDEDRCFSVQKVKRCPMCQSAIHLPVLRRWFDAVRTANYQISCSNPDCEYATPPMPNSQDAVRHWQLSAILGG